MVGTFIYSGFE